MAAVPKPPHPDCVPLFAEARGDMFHVERRLFIRDASGAETVLRPLDPSTHLAVGDEVEVHLAIRAAHAAEYVHLRDPRPAGFEPASTTSGPRWDLGLRFYEEVRDSATNFFFEKLPAGQVAPVDVEIFPTGAVIAKGHRLRIAVQAFDVPHLLSPVTDLVAQLVPVTVHTGPQYPSVLTMAVR